MPLSMSIVVAFKKPICLLFVALINDDDDDNNTLADSQSAERHTMF